MHYFGWNTKRYENQHAEIYTTESSDRAFEEEVMLSGLVLQTHSKSRRSGISYDEAQETLHCTLHTMETIALAFAITEEAIEG